MKPATNLGNNQPPVADNIPEAMRAALRWLLHDGDKKPFYASGRPRAGKLNSPRDLGQLVSFEDALVALTQFEGRFAGLGFALGEGWHGVDLDDVRNPKTGAIIDWAADLIEKAATYAEISPSGKGVHLIGFETDIEVKLTITLGSNGSGVEFYTGARYFTVTGNRLNGIEGVRRFSEDVIDLVTRLHQPKAATPPLARKDFVSFTGTGASLEWPGFRDELHQKLRHVPAGRGHDRWKDIGMGIHWVCGGSEEGFQIWHEWSKANHGGELGKDGKPAYKGEEECRYQWKSFKPRKDGKKWGTVRHWLDQYQPKPAPPRMDGEALPFADITVEPVERRALIEGWLYDRVVLLQAADGGSGKSYMGLLEAMMLAGGYSCGMGWKVEPGKVLFYTGEDDADVLRWRMRRYCNFYGWRLETFRESLAIVDRSETDCTLYHEGRNGTGEFTEEYSRLVRTVTRFDPAYVVIDNASHVFNGNENNRATVRHFLSGLTALKRAVNLLAHVNKVTAGGNGNQAVAYSGSTAWNNTVRSRRAQVFEEGHGTITIAKSNYGPTGTTLRYDWDDNAKLFLPRALVQREYAREHSERLFAIVRQLAGRPASLSAQATSYLGRLMQVHPDYPKGIDARGLNRWISEQAALGRLVVCEVKDASRHITKGVAVR